MMYILMIDNEPVKRFETFEMCKVYCESLVDNNYELYFRKPMYIYKKRENSDKYDYDILFTCGIWVHNVQGETLMIKEGEVINQSIAAAGTTVKIKPDKTFLVKNMSNEDLKKFVCGLY